MWGTTRNGGVSSLGGCIFRVKLDGSAWEVVYAFSSDSSNVGREPYAGLVSDGEGWLWGTTNASSGGSFGTVFKIDVTTHVVTTVVEFSNNGPQNKGAQPQAALLNDGDGSLWGTTSAGGASNAGTVFKIDISSGTLQTIIEFTGTSGVSLGKSPLGSLIADVDGIVWGTTSSGGLGNLGTVFKIDPATNLMTTVVEFSGNGAQNRGSTPRGSLLEAPSGILWGTTYSGGANSYGTLFQIDRATGLLTTVVESSTLSGLGFHPAGDLLDDGLGFLWGATESGAGNFGAIFKVEMSSGNVTTVAEFDAATEPEKGSTPRAGLTGDGQGSIWGTTKVGGANVPLYSVGNGTVFKIDIATSALSTVTNFNFQEPYYVEGGLVMDPDGNLWGTSKLGGRAGYGTIFRIDAGSTVASVVVEFTGRGGAAKGSGPHSGLTLDAYGDLWGTTESGGMDDYGTVFRVDHVTGALTTVAELTSNGAMNKGAWPRGRLLYDGVGKMWGTTYGGGSSDSGTVFKVDVTSGELTTTGTFVNTSGNFGSRPVSGLVADGNGFIWGTAPLGGTGASGGGTVFTLSLETGVPTSVFAFPYSYANGANGFRPTVGLEPDGLGFLWGSTDQGLVSSYGSIYKVSASSGMVTTVRNVLSRDGVEPSKLLYDGRGNFWQTRVIGYAVDSLFKINSLTGVGGTVFEFSASGTGLRSGQSPGREGLVKGADGNLYGTTRLGGPSGGGTVYRVRLGPTPVTLAASDVHPTSVTLHGEMNPNGVATSVAFEFGLSPEVLDQTATSALLSPTTSATVVELPVTGLVPATTYYYRLRGENTDQLQPQVGEVLSFTTPADGLISFGTPLSYIPANGSVDIPIIRTDGSAGAATVLVNSSDESAMAPADYTPMADVAVTFESGETQKAVHVVAGDSAGKTFRLTLTAPAVGGGIIGAIDTTQIQVIDGNDRTRPSVTITSPRASANLLEGTSVEVTGSAADRVQLNKVEVSVNGAAFADAVLTLVPGGKSGSYSLPLTPLLGKNTVTVRSVDFGYNRSTPVTRVFNYIVQRPLSVGISGPENSGVITAGFLPSSTRKVGFGYRLTATARSGFVFAGWTANDWTGTGVTDDSRHLRTLSFTMVEGLELTANFVQNYFPAFAYPYNGLVLPSGSPTPGIKTNGFIAITVTKTGSFSGKLTLDGSVLSFRGVLDTDGVGRFGTALRPVVSLARRGRPTIDLSVAYPVSIAYPFQSITGTVTVKDGSDVVATALFTAPPSFYNSKQVVPSALTPMGRSSSAYGRYTVVFPAVNQSTALDFSTSLSAADYPQSAGYGFVKVRATGLVSLSGVLADGTAVSSSSRLSWNPYVVPFFRQIYSAKGGWGGVMKFDLSQADSDLSCPDGVWLRPTIPGQQYYPNGWPAGILVDLVGALYAAQTGTSVLSGLGVADADGNADLDFTGGLLSPAVHGTVSISTADKVVNTPADATFRLAINRTTGLISGSFTDSSGKKPPFKGVILQKGANAGGRGYFLSVKPRPVDGLGQSGSVMLSPQ